MNDNSIETVDPTAAEPMSVAEKALELACADAWPGKTQWKALYLKKARQVLGVEAYRLAHPSVNN